MRDAIAIAVLLLGSAACSSPAEPRVGSTPLAEDTASPPTTAAPEADASAREADVTPSATATATATATASPTPTSTATATPSTSAAPTAPARSPAVATLDKVETENGEVPEAEKKLTKRLPAIEKCVNDAGGIEGKKATLTFQFLVRAAGVIEGIDVEKAPGISPEAVKCVVGALKRKDVGAPSSDPVGVKCTLTFTPSGAATKPR